MSQPRRKDDDDTEVNRLTSIDSEEVSVVDAAANKRRFLIVKREDPSMSTELKSDGSGNLTDASDDDKSGTEVSKGVEGDDATDDDKSDDDSSDDDDDDDTTDDDDDDDDEVDVDKAKAKTRPFPIEEEEDSKVKPKGKDTTKQEGEHTHKLPNGTTTGKSPEGAGHTHTILGGKKTGPPVEAGDSHTHSVPDGGKTSPAKPAAEGGAPPFPPKAKAKGKGKPAHKADDGATDDGGKNSSDEPVGKAGRRMSKDRLDRFHKALDLLSKLIDELGGEQKPSVSKSEAAGDDVAIDSVLAGIGELSTVAKRQAGQIESLTKEVAALKSENAQLKKGVVDRNSVDVETDERASDAAVSWPLDLNDEVTPERVGKANWFK